MIIEALEKVLAGEDLTCAQADAVADEIASGRASIMQVCALLTALDMKGATKDETCILKAGGDRASEQSAQCNLPTKESSSPGEFLGLANMLVGQGNDMSRREAENAMEDILCGQAYDSQIAQFLAALRFKGETVNELVGFASAMRRHATPIFAPDHKAPHPLVDTCGTGGDARGTFNVSTAAAFVVAGAGVHVAKHGNRSISSKCGSADVLEALGVRIDLAPERVGQAIEEIGIGFLFAPAVHAATRHAMPVRRELKIRTVFNLLGPLTNPAGASAQVAGVYDAGFTELLARALDKLGVRRAFVVHGADGLDEVSTSGDTSVAELRDGAVRSYTVTPEDFGVPRAPLEAIRGGDAANNAEIVHRILGRAGHAPERGPRRDIVLANAAAALVAAGRAKDFLEGIRCAAQSIDSGAARARLEALIDFTGSEQSFGQTSA